MTAPGTVWDAGGVLRLFRQVSLREHRQHWGRALLVVAGIATGIALIVAIDIVNSSVLASFRTTFAALAGPAELEVTLGIGEVGFADDVAEIVRRDPDVALAVPLVRGTIAVADDSGETLQLFGAELTAEEDLARYGIQLTSARRTALAGLDDPHTILVGERFALRRGLAVGSTLALATARGVDTFTIRGLLTSDGVARLLGGQLAVMDLAAAQTQLAKEDRLDQLDLVLRPGADVATARVRLASALPSTLNVGAPATRAASYGDILAGLQATFDGMSMLCVLAGLFIVYNATATGVVHRAPVIGALRVIGADGRQLRVLLLVEAAALGALGAASGALIGIVLARFLVVLVGNVMGTMVQIRFIVPELALAAPRQALVATAGVVVALCAAWIPARQATRLDPLAVAGGATLLGAHARTRTLALVWAALVALTIVLLVVGEYWHLTAVAAASVTVWGAGALVGGVLLVNALADVLPRWLPRLFGVVGKVAGASVVRAPVRNGVTVGTIALVTAISLAVASITASYLVTVDDYITEMHDGDLTVSAVTTEGGWVEAPLAPEIVPEVERIAGVRRVEAVRIVPGQTFRGTRTGLLALAPEAIARLGAAVWRAGDRLTGREALASGRAVAVSTIFSDRFGIGVGDRLDIETPKGILTLPVAGLLADVTSNSGAVILSRPLYEEWWGDGTVSRFNVYLEPGLDLDEARRRITAQLGARHRLKILTLRDNLEYHDDKIRRAFAFVDTLKLLVAIVTVAGVFDLLWSGILERRRELAVWRLIGADNRAVRLTIVVESLTLGALAAVIALFIGAVTAWMWVRVLIPHLIGYDLTYALAPLPTAMTIALVLLLTALAGWAASARATRASVLDGIRSQ